MRTRLCFLFLWLGFTSSAFGQICGTYPYTLTNGTTADASQVMGDFNHVRNCVNNMTTFMRGWLSGLTMANNVTTPNTVIDTSAGIANADDSSTLMSLAAFSKNANAAWAVGSGNGCLDSGSSLTANTWYHVFVIARADTGVIDQLCSTSATGPTLPTSYTKKRRIGSFRTNSSAQILGFIQDGDYFRWLTSVLDVDATDPGTAAVTRTLTVPSGVNVQALINAQAAYNAVGHGIGLYLSDLAANDETPSGSAAPLMQAMNADYIQAYTALQIRTNLSSQIRSRLNYSDSLTVLRIATLGWIDTRGRFQ